MLLLSSCAAADDQPLEPTTELSAVTPSSTPTIVWFPPTATPTAPFIVQPTPTPESFISYGELLLDDQFESDADWTPGDTTAGNMVVSNSELTLALAAPGATLSTTRKDFVTRDFYLETTLTASLCRQSDSFGLIYAAVTPREYHRVAFTCGGLYRLEKVYFQRVTPLTDWQSSSQAVRGPGVPVRVHIWSGNGVIRLYLNDQFEFEYLVNPPAGSIGFFTSSAGDTAVTVSFSDLQVYQVTRADFLPTVAPTIPPTKTPVPTAPKP